MGLGFLDSKFVFSIPWLSGCMCNVPRRHREAKQEGHQFESLNPNCLMKFLHPREPGLQNNLLLANTTDLSLRECCLGFLFFQARSHVYLHALPERSELSRRNKIWSWRPAAKCLSKCLQLAFHPLPHWRLVPKPLSFFPSVNVTEKQQPTET